MAAEVQKDHYKKHRNPGKCVLCTWQRNYPRWSKELPSILPEWDGLDVKMNTRPHVEIDRTWVQIRQGGKGHYRAYCVACKDFRTDRKRLELQDLRKHHLSEKHKRAMLDLLGLRVGPHSVSVSAAPPYDQFAMVWQGGLDNVHKEEIACRKKCDQIRECLFEAICNARREFLSKAQTVMILRDESKGYLLIRIMACDDEFNQMVFPLGLRFASGGDAFNIQDATREIIDEFCTPLVALPGGTALEPKALAARIKSKLEAVCVDSAANELKASRLMMKSIAPNLKVIVRDHAHASRRLLSRPWHADEHLDMIAKTLVMGRHSICQRIQNSPEFRTIYGNHIKHVVQGPFRKTVGLGAAKHRFESWSKPFGMVVMTLKALIRTAEDISITRQGNEEAQDAEDFLDFLTVPHILQTAMMADAADEVLIVTRTFDAEECDIATQASCLEVLLERIVSLFIEGACFVTGYTKEVIKNLESEVTVVKKRGKTLTSFGGRGSVTEAVKEDCQNRMMNWVKLCHHVVKAEFPEFDLIHAFWVFSALDLQMQSHDELDVPDWVSSLERLSKAFGLNGERVCREFAKCLPIVKRRVKQLNEPVKEAWKFALERARVERRSCDALRHIIYRYVGWGLSTSGVERNFSSARTVLQHRNPATIWKCRVTLEMAAGMPEDAKLVKATIPVAQEVWALQHGPVQAKKYTQRVDKGVPRQPSSSTSAVNETRAGWLRKRRAEVSAAVVRGSGAKKADNMELPESFQKEVAFLAEKRNKRKYEALESNQLLEHEIDEEVQAGAREFYTRRAKQDRQLENEKRLKQQKLEAKPIELTALRGKKVYISKRASDDYDQTYLAKQAEHLGAIVVEHVLDASIVVVPDLDPEHLGIKVAWTSMLRGCTLIMPAFLLDKSKAALTFKASVSFWRRVFITDDFRAKHPELVDVVTRACASPSSKWELLPTIDEFNKQFKKAQKDARPGQVVMLKRTKDRVQGVHQGARVLDFKAFQNSINKVDASLTSSG